MYRTFYPLLAEINESYLLVMNEMMRDGNRSCLTYNCVAKYTNQTPHRLVFEFLPNVGNPADIMILLDFDLSQRYKGRGLQDIDLMAENILCVRRDYRLDVIQVDIPNSVEAAYEAEKAISPAAKAALEAMPEGLYVARNSRYKRPNVFPYSEAESGKKYTLLDIQHSRKDMNDFFRRTGEDRPSFISTGLKVDQYYIGAHEQWRKEVEKIYAETGLYQEDRR